MSSSFSWSSDVSCFEIPGEAMREWQRDEGDGEGGWR